MIRFSIILCCVLMWAVPGRAATQYDMAYYLGLVTASGGSTLTDGVWSASGERGAENSLQDGVYSSSPENVNIAHHTDGGYSLLSSYWYNEDASAWILSDVRIFHVGADYLEYCGVLLVEEGMIILPDKRLRFPRYMGVGDIGALSTACTAHTSSGDITSSMYLSLFLQKDGITVSNGVPSTVTNCLRAVIGEGTGLTNGSHVFVLGPGKGQLLYANTDYSPADMSDSAPLGITDVYLSLSVTQFGTSASYAVSGATAFATPASLDAMEAQVDGLAIPTEYVDSSGGGAVVIPMF